MTKDELRAREHDIVPLDVCQAVHDTIAKEKYKIVFTDVIDPNLEAWINLAGATLTDQVRLGIGLAFIGSDIPDLTTFSKKIKKGGQIAFYGQSAAPLRAFFNRQENYDQWLTVELPLEAGVFIARKI